MAVLIEIMILCVKEKCSVPYGLSSGRICTYCGLLKRFIIQYINCSSSRLSFFIFPPPSCRELYIYTKLMTCHRQEVSGGCGRVRTWCCISDELEARVGEGVWKRWFVGVGVR